MTIEQFSSNPTPDPKLHTNLSPAPDFQPGLIASSTAEKFGALIKAKMSEDPNFYLFSPDETTSNKLDAAYQVSSRAWNLEIKSWDLPSSENGRIIEILSENLLFSCLSGHLLSGGTGLMTSYEAFFNIITSQVVQHLKFLSQSNSVSWRPKYPALNLLSTSTCWRQDHNGFSHQSPLLISSLLSFPSPHYNCLFPVDDIEAESVFRFQNQSTNHINLITFNKTKEPRWLNPSASITSFKPIEIFEFASDPQPDFIFTAAGDIATREALYAIKLLKQTLPGIKLRFVKISALSYNALGTSNQPLSLVDFQNFYGSTPIIANFHGYPQALHAILSHYQDPKLITTHGYREIGSTTTPFEMLSLNSASRYHLAISVLKQLNRSDLISRFEAILEQNRLTAFNTSLDLPEIADFRF